MAIKDKDGSVYKLRGPNPLMKSQEDWDKKDLKLINMKQWKSETIKDENNPIEKFKENFNVVELGEKLDLFKGPENPKTTVIGGSDFIDDINSEIDIEQPLEKIEEVEVEIEVAEEQVNLHIDENMARLIKTRGAEFYCAPSIGVKEHVDDLYGDSYTTIKYGDAFLFDAVLIDESDFQLQFWCVKNIKTKSIIYKKKRQGGERWWRVSESENKTGGFLVSCVISDSNPDFT